MQPQYVTEIDVIIAVAKWLHSNEWTVERLSIPHGSGLVSGSKAKDKLRNDLTAVGIQTDSIRFLPKGEDIVARQRNSLWRIECKGLSAGKQATVKNNFDRAVASAVSYYDHSEGLRLGIALPDDKQYVRLCRNKLPKALRGAITLWVFLYENINEVYEFSPEEELPSLED
ncbi:MAG: hypothetical protein HY530_00655 [Chloroflexi bacterium]|nr:hypothetical protein [Chloroflexota bacterium]